MACRMVLIGYLPDEFASARQKWASHPFILDYADSPERANLMQDAPQVDLAVFHSRVLDSIPYITVMRSHGSVPFLVVTPEHTNMQQTQDAVKQIFEATHPEISHARAIVYGDLYFCKEQRLVRVRGEEVSLTAKEFDLFTLLVSNPKRVFTYEIIAELIWGEPYDYGLHKTISNHIASLRKKLTVAPDIPNYIQSVHSVGYKFDVS